MTRGIAKSAVALALVATVATAAASESGLLRALGDFGDAMARSTQVVAKLTERVVRYDGTASNALVRRAAASGARAASQELDKALEGARDREKPLASFAERVRADTGDAAGRGKEWSLAVAELRAGTSRLGDAVERVVEAPAIGSMLGGRMGEVNTAAKAQEVIGVLEASGPPSNEPELGAVDAAATRYRAFHGEVRQLSDALRDKARALSEPRARE